MGKGIFVLRECLGLNNKVDPLRIGFDPEKGLSELAVAYNISIDRTGRIDRVKGYTNIARGKSHSLFPFKDYCLVVNSGVLYILNRDYSLESLCMVDAEARISYVSVGDRLYFMNGYMKGFIENRELFPWEQATYVGPVTSRVYSPPPIGHLIELHNAYMFVAQDNVLWYSMPFSYHSFDLNKGNLVFPSRITMVKSVVSSLAERGGLYVSDENKTYFMSGMRPKEFIQIEVADYPAVEGTGILIDGRKVGKGDVQNNVIMWVSTEGICLGSPDGVFMNLTERKLKYPKANSGAGVCIDDKYVCTLKAPSWTSADGFI